MSDDQILDLFQNAAEWSPDEDDGGEAGDGSGTGDPGPAPTLALPPLQLGSDVEIARCVAQLLRQERGEVVFSEGDFWYYAASHWRQIEDYELRLAVHRYDNATVSGASSRVKLGKPRVDSVLYEMRAILARPNFFAKAPVGINCASGFIAFSSDGAPTIHAHDPEHRCRHVLKGAWNNKWILDVEEIFVV